MFFGNSKQKRIQGMTLVELLITVALIALVFGALMSSFQFIVALIGTSKAQAGAVALANERLEFIRSLPYDDVGTQGGIPNGPIPQNSTTTLNGLEYTQRVLISYVDAPQDGEGALDGNGILADYKQVKVEYSWYVNAATTSISLITNIVPRGIETTVGGGTLKVNVFDANVQPLQGASVHIYNDNGTSTIDTVRSTNSDGVAMFAGAPALADYEITVTKAGYSTDQTYAASATNTNPTTRHASVLESEVSTMNFQIDELSTLAVETISMPTTGEFEDNFDDSTKIASQSGTQIASSTVTLAGAPGSYALSGTILSTAVAPGAFDSWNTVSFDADIPLDTSLLVHIYDASGSSTPTLIPDTDLPGNSAGFAPGSIDITGLDTSAYPVLALGAALGTSNTATTSLLLEWSISHTVSRPSIANVPFTLTGNKTIGADASSTPIYKYEEAFTTDGTGDVAISDLEWDLYAVDVTDASYVIAEACEDIPYALEPGVSETLTLTLAPASAYTLRVRVDDINGEPIPDADVELSRPGFTTSAETSTCGQVFFDSGVSAATDFQVEVDAPGYAPQLITPVIIDGNNAVTAVLTEL